MKTFSRVNLAKILVFVALMNTVIFVSTAVLHEAGHAILGLLSGCEQISIVIFELPSQATYTSMHCPHALSPSLVLLSSFILVLPVALLFLTLGGFREQYMGIILLGGNLLGAFLDAAMLTSSVIANYAVVFSGILLVMWGEDLMVRATLDDRTPDLLERIAQGGEGEEEEDGEGEDGEAPEDDEEEGETGGTAAAEEGGGAKPS